MSGLFDALRERVGYVFSLPERTIRSLAAIAGGTTSLLTETLFPDVLRGTTLYKIFLGDAQRFVVERVAEVQREKSEAGDAEAASDDYVQRKMIGGALETAGLFAMHFSPLWVFAIAGDAAAGSKVFFNRLVDQLKKNGVLPEDTEVTGLNDLLIAMQEASRKSAGAIDTPPLSREDVVKLADEMNESYKNIFAKATNLLPRIEAIWEQMEKVASRENISIERLGGVLTVDIASWGKKGIGTVLAVGQTGSGLFGEQILESYTRTLEAVSEEGVTGYITHRMKPFLQSAANHFSPEKKTWTESILGVGGKSEESAEQQPQSDSAQEDQPITPSDKSPPEDNGSDPTPMT